MELQWKKAYKGFEAQGQKGEARRFAATFLAGVESGDATDVDLIDSYEGDPRVVSIALALETAGVAGTLEEKLGSGSFGTAWAVEGDRVAKLTADSTEVRAAYFLSQRKALPHVVEFFNAWVIGGVEVLATAGWDPAEEEPIKKRVPVGLTIMQRLGPVDFQGRHRLTRRVHEYKSQNGLSWEELSNLSHAKQRAKLRSGSEGMEMMLREAATKDPEREQLYDNVADALGELRAIGLFAIDAHGGNVGLDEEVGVYKLFDIGVSSVPGKMQPPALREHDGTFEVPVQVPVLRGTLPGMATAASSARDYIAVDNQGKLVAGPFTSYSDAKRHADGAGGYVKWMSEGKAVACEDFARDFVSPEAAADHEREAGGVMGVVGDGLYVFYPNRTMRRIYYSSGKYHIESRAEPMPMSKRRAATAPRAAAAEKNTDNFKVAYLGARARRIHLASGYSLDGASREMRALKRRGMTAWVEDGKGNFVPVAGATRPPKFNEDKAEMKLGIAGKKSKMKEDFAVATRDVKAVRAGRAVGTLGNSRAIYDWVSPMLVKFSQEVVLCIPLDLRGRPLNGKPYVVAMGQKAEVSVEADDIIRPAIKDNCSGFVVVHNHPSGKGVPSEADKQLTDKIRSKAPDRTPMIDHVVCGDGQFYSFADDKLYEVRKKRK